MSTLFTESELTDRLSMQNRETKPIDEQENKRYEKREALQPFFKFHQHGRLPLRVSHCVKIQQPKDGWSCSVGISGPSDTRAVRPGTRRNSLSCMQPDSSYNPLAIRDKAYWYLGV